MIDTVKSDENERAVSPVIGVILMVAITVILAAVIAAFVLDLGGSIGEEAQAGVDIEADSDDQIVAVSITSMGNSESVELRGDVTFVDGEEDEFVDGEYISLSSSGEGASIGSDDDVDEHYPDGSGSDIEDVSEDHYVTGETGTVNVVAITSEGAETTISSESFDFSED